MSAKEAYRKPVIHIDRLPGELIGEVFHHATWVPYWIDPSDMVFDRLRSTKAKDLYKEYRASLVRSNTPPASDGEFQSDNKPLIKVTRRYLVRVCRAWHKIAALYLYQWLVLGRLKNLQGLIAAVERGFSDDSNSPSGDPGGTTIGCCTRRLDIGFRRGGDEVDEEDVGGLLLRLLCALPNLQVLTVKDSFDYHWLDPSVSHTFCPKLQIFNWCQENDLLPSEFWHDFIASHPDLVAFNPALAEVRSPQPGHIDVKPWSTSQLLPTIHDQLQTYSVQLTIPPSTLILPSLQRLNIIKDYSDTDHPDWITNLTPYTSTQSLTAIQLGYIHSVNYPKISDDFSRLAPFFASVPNLQRIDIVLSKWPEGWAQGDPFDLPSTVSILGICIVSCKPSKSRVIRFLEKLGQIVRSARSPLAIQLLDSATMEYVLVYRDALVREQGVLLSWLDPDGKLFKLEF